MARIKEGVQAGGADRDVCWDSKGEERGTLSAGEADLRESDVDGIALPVLSDKPSGDWEADRGDRLQFSESGAKAFAESLGAIAEIKEQV